MPDATNFIKQYITAIRNNDFSLIDFEHLPLNSIAVEKSRIAENEDFNLSGDRYKINTTRKHSKFEMVTLGDVCNFTGGFAFKSDELLDEIKESCLPVVKIGNLHKDGFIDLKDVQYFEYNESLKKYLIQKDDILIAMTGATVGKVAISNEDNLLLNQRVGLIRANEELINKDFLKALLLSEKFYEYCQFTAGGGAQGNISPTEIMNFKFPLPDLTFQESISGKISNANKIIAGAKQVVENYKPQIDIKPEWEMVELGKVCEDIKSGFAYGKSEKNNEGVLHIRPMNITINGNLTMEGSKFIPIEEFNLFINYDLKKGDVLFNNTNSKELVGKTCYIYDDLVAGFSNHITRIRVKQKELIPIFLSLILNQFRSNGIFLKICNKWIGQAGINNTALSNLKIPLPPLSEQDAIVAQIEKEQQLINASKELIKIYEQKIKDEINKLWEE